MGERTHLGLDVHKETTAVAILRPGQQEPNPLVIPTTPEAYRKLIAKLDSPDLVACYEAGPCGYEPHRILTALGVPCDVIAPSLIPRRPGDHVKTDRLDARRLARMHRAGELTAIEVPTPRQEAIRDLVRTREDLKEDQRRAVQRIKSFLLRHGKPFPARKGFNAVHEQWAAGLRFEEPHAEQAFGHLMAAYQTRKLQIQAVDLQLAEAAMLPELAGPVSRLRVLRGIDTLSALTIVSEICDVRQFPNAASFMAFTGLVPSEHSSGERTRRGSITKAGNTHIRRVLVEAAWAYRHRPAIGYQLRKRQEGQPAPLLAHSWKAQERPHHRYRQLGARKNRNVAVIAVARELAGFVWAIMHEEAAA